MLNYLTFLDSREDRDFFEQIYHKYRLRMYYVAYGYMKEESDAEDMVHETFLTLTKNMDKLSKKDCHKTWNYIVTILKNKCIDCLRHQKHYTDREIDALYHEQNSETDPQSRLIRKEEEKMMAVLLNELKYPYKEVLMLQYYQKMRGKEIAAVLGMSEENVRKISSRARRILKEWLRKEGYDYGR